jgi:hypothetical protein
MTVPSGVSPRPDGDLLNHSLLAGLSTEAVTIHDKAVSTPKSALRP